MNQNSLENKSQIVSKIVSIDDTDLISAIVALEKKEFREEAGSSEDLKQKMKEGMTVLALWNGREVVGSATAYADADPNNTKSLLKRMLPKESLLATGAIVDLESRGKGLQKILLEKRKELARELKKETVIGTARPENAPSLRNITSSGGRILAYSSNYFPDSKNPARVIWEIDVTPQNESKDNITQNKEFPDLVVNIKNGEEADTDARKQIEKILLENYVGVDVKTSGKDNSGASLDTTIVFRHLSKFSPKSAERLLARKKKIQDILKLEQEKLDVRIEIAGPKDWEAYKKIILEAINGNDAYMLGMTPEKVRALNTRIDKIWQNALVKDNDRFVLLSWNDSEVVGTINAKKEEKDWYVGSLYVKQDENFRHKGVGQKMFAACLQEIQNRGGEKITLGVKASNYKSINLVEPFHFKQPEDVSFQEGFYMTLNNVNDPEVIEKINEVLNAG